MRNEVLDGRHQSLEQSHRDNLQRIKYYKQHPELLIDCDECNSSLGWAYFIEEASEKRPVGKAKSVEVMSKAVELAPENPIHYASLATYQRDLGGTKESIKTCELSLQMVPLDYTLHVRLYWAYLELEQTKKAVAILDQMVERFPRKIEPLLIRRREVRLQASQAYLERAIASSRRRS